MKLKVSSYMNWWLLERSCQHGRLNWFSSYPYRVDPVVEVPVGHVEKDVVIMFQERVEPGGLKTMARPLFSIRGLM